MSAKLNAKKKAFVSSLLETGHVTKSASACGFDRGQLYVERHKDDEFKKAWDEALDIAVDSLIDEAQRRAHDGIEEPVFYLGQVCGTVRRYSDTLLMFLIKGKRAEYATERRQLTGADNGAVKIENMTREGMEARVRELMEKANGK